MATSTVTDAIQARLNFDWVTIMKNLNVGNREQNPNKNAPTEIHHEDVLESRILSDGSLYTRKLINKPVGSNKFLIPLLAPFGAEFPKYTDVIEESLINPTDHTAWQWTRNVHACERYLGYAQVDWLYLSERVCYVPLAAHSSATFVTKHLESKSFINGKLSWIGIPALMTSKGQKRWRQRSGNQIDRLKTKIENSLRQNETNHVGPKIEAAVVKSLAQSEQI